MASRRLLLPLILATAVGACGSENPGEPPTDTSAINLTIGWDSLPVIAGNTIQLIAVALDSQGDSIPSTQVLWRSIDPTRAVVSQTGLVRALRPGVTEIRVSSGRETASIEFVVDPTGIRLTTPSVVGVGFETQIELAFLQPDGRTAEGELSVTWTSTNSNIARIDSVGTVRGLAPGRVGIKASTGATVGIVQLEVSGVRVAAVDIQADSVPAVIGRNVTLTTIPRDSIGGAIGTRATRWWSSDSTVAVPDQNGIVSLIATGQVSLFAQIEGAIGQLDFAVDPSLLAMVTTPAEILVGAAMTLEVGRPISSNRFRRFEGQVSWTSADSTTVQVDSLGVATAIAPGTATITASTASQTVGVALTVDSVTWTGFSVGGRHTCAETNQSTIYCWGDAGQAQLGTGNEINRVTPSRVQTPLQLNNVTAGRDHSCAFDVSGSVLCWGLTSRLGVGSASADPVYDPTVSYIPTGPVTLSAGFIGTCALDNAGESHCWGTIPGTGFLPNATVIPGPVASSAVTIGWSHTCSIGIDGKTRCWGSAAVLLGRLDPDSTEIHQDPIFVQISAGGGFTCGVASDDFAYCWGLDIEGQLGTDSIPCGGILCDLELSLFPTKVGGGLIFSSVTSGGWHACGIDTGGTAYCWGRNVNGQLGDGTLDMKTQPIQVSGGLQFQSIEAGENHTCALTLASKIYCWGKNEFGALGDGTTEDRMVPTRVPGS